MQSARIAVIGLGYVGLPLAVEFGKTRPVIGFDIKADRISALQDGVDSTREVDAADLRSANGLRFTSDPEDLRGCNTFIITVPTPISADTILGPTPARQRRNTVSSCCQRFRQARMTASSLRSHIPNSGRFPPIRSAPSATGSMCSMTSRAYSRRQKQICASDRANESHQWHVS
ncbi:MAG: hypothetical protein JJU42_03370 [Rhodobacteraceae bacterium]|nr:hypothetical protein [Paracoccaceae bacterium]